MNIFAIKWGSFSPLLTPKVTHSFSSFLGSLQFIHKSSDQSKKCHECYCKLIIWGKFVLDVHSFLTVKISAWSKRVLGLSHMIHITNIVLIAAKKRIRNKSCTQPALSGFYLQNGLANIYDYSSIASWKREYTKKKKKKKAYNVSLQAYNEWSNQL